jgi:hypothetical protein
VIWKFLEVLSRGLKTLSTCEAHVSPSRTTQVQNARRLHMTTILAITSLDQGKIFGDKPSLEDFERQLENDAMTLAVGQLGSTLSQLARRVISTKQKLGKLVQVRQSGPAWKHHHL